MARMKSEPPSRGHARGRQAGRQINHRLTQMTQMNMIEEEYKYADITRRIIGCAMRVHNKLGSGFQEVIYQRALVLEMREEDLAFEREKEMPIIYNEIQIGARRVDFLVEGVIMVELKAITEINDINRAQIINYLEAYKLNIGLLINFGQKRLEFKRFINS